MKGTAIEEICRSVYLHDGVHDDSVDNPTADKLKALEVAHSNSREVTSCMDWGSGPSDKLLFASSANNEDHTGTHKAFNISQRRREFHVFEANGEAGSRMALDASGKYLFPEF